jgi:hypothetical protein
VCLLLTPHRAFKCCIESNRREFKYLNLNGERALLIEVKAQLLQFSEYASLNRTAIFHPISTLPIPEMPERPI